MLASLTHPNVIAYREAFVDQQPRCIIMEYADGGDYLQNIKEQSKTKNYFSESEVIKIYI